jgi:hypothetical protein
MDIVSLGQASVRAPSGQTRTQPHGCFAFGKRRSLEDYSQRVCNVDTEGFHAHLGLGRERRILHECAERFESG